MKLAREIAEKLELAGTLDAVYLSGIVDEVESIVAAKLVPVREALEAIVNDEGERCRRCEGSGAIYADGKAHYVTEGAPTISCPYCGGSGRVIEDAREIATTALALQEESTMSVIEYGIDAVRKAADGVCPACGSSRLERGVIRTTNPNLAVRCNECGFEGAVRYEPRSILVFGGGD